MEAHEYIRRHTRCLAIRVSEHNVFEVAQWCGSDKWSGGIAVRVVELHQGKWKPGERQAAYGDWIVRLPDQRFQVLTDDAFRAEWAPQAVQVAS